MTGIGPPSAPASRRISGWIEAGGFVVALTALNLAYGAAHAASAHPIAFITYAMVFAAAALILITGPGPHWPAVVRHPLSWVIGSGIIGMEACYFLLLRYVTPADGSLLIRLNLPFSLLVGWLLLGREVRGLAVLGVAFVVVAIAWFIGGIDAAVQVPAMTFALLCALISVTRNFSAEFHPHNRRAQTVWEKMRITGLMLLVTSLAGTLFIALLMGATAARLIEPLPGVPSPADFAHPPTVLIGAFTGLVVLMAMQYFGFSAVVKIGTESFIAANSFLPLTTLAAQSAAASLGLMSVASPDGRFFVALAAILIGVTIYIVAARHRE